MLLYYIHELDFMHFLMYFIFIFIYNKVELRFVMFKILLGFVILVKVYSGKTLVQLIVN